MTSSEAPKINKGNEKIPPGSRAARIALKVGAVVAGAAIMAAGFAGHAFGERSSADRQAAGVAIHDTNTGHPGSLAAEHVTPKTVAPTKPNIAPTALPEIPSSLLPDIAGVKVVDEKDYWDKSTGTEWAVEDIEVEGDPAAMVFELEDGQWQAEEGPGSDLQPIPGAPDELNKYIAGDEGSASTPNTTPGTATPSTEATSAPASSTTPQTVYPGGD